MEDNRVISILERARRALDSLPQVEIINDWGYDTELQIWFLHISIFIDKENTYFPKNSQWFVIVEATYPKGYIKVYPDIEKSIEVTLFHQANNANIAQNGKWRTGALCLDVNDLSSVQQEPTTIDDRLLYHVERAINWLQSAANEKLVSSGELFEMPEFTIGYKNNIQFAFSEDVVTYMQWESTDCRYGIADIAVYKKNPLIYYVKNYKSINNIKEHYSQWGKYLLHEVISPPIKALWILLDKLPVINVWQAPETFNDLYCVLKNQGVDIYSVLEKIVPQIRDGKRHLLLLGFPIPRVFGEDADIIFWQALYLPTMSFGKLTAKGFRPNENGWWWRDRREVLTSDMKLEWIVSENWNQQEISQRGKIDNLVQRKRILLIGAGCMGASIGEIFVRTGACNLTICDADIFEVGNLARHTLNLEAIGKRKEVELVEHLNKINPHANIKIIKEKLYTATDNQPNIELSKYDIIIDCTGANNVFEILSEIEFKRNRVFASFSVGLGANRLYASIMNGKKYNFESFYNLITPYIEEEKKAYNKHVFPRDGTGCWHPTFPGRSDDIWLAASTAVKVIEKYIMSQSENTFSAVYEQRYVDNIFQGFLMVDKDE